MNRHNVLKLYQWLPVHMKEFMLSHRDGDMNDTYSGESYLLDLLIQHGDRLACPAIFKLSPEFGATIGWKGDEKRRLVTIKAGPPGKKIFKFTVRHDRIVVSNYGWWHSHYEVIEELSSHEEVWGWMTPND